MFVCYICFLLGVFVGGVWFIVGVLRPGSIYGHTRTGTNMWQYTIIADIIKSVRRHHDAVSHSVTLSWHWANQFLPCPNTAECQARKRQVSNFKSLVWLDQSLNTTDAQFFWPSHLGRLAILSYSTSKQQIGDCNLLYFIDADVALSPNWTQMYRRIWGISVLSGRVVRVSDFFPKLDS